VHPDTNDIGAIVVGAIPRLRDEHGGQQQHGGRGRGRRGHGSIGPSNTRGF
jgi:hypothetical protein